jgi:hypothetical protein
MNSKIITSAIFYLESLQAFEIDDEQSNQIKRTIHGLREIDGKHGQDIANSPLDFFHYTNKDKRAGQK